MNYISQFANAQAVQQKLDADEKLKNFAMQVCHEFNLRVSEHKENRRLNLTSEEGLPVGVIAICKDYRSTDEYYEISMPDIISKEKSSARSDRNSRDSDKISTLLKSIKKNKEIPTTEKLTKNYLQCLYYALSRVGESAKPSISVHNEVALSAIKYALGLDTNEVQLHTAKLQEIYDKYMSEVNELSSAESDVKRYLKGCTAIGIVGGRYEDNASYYLVGEAVNDGNNSLKFQGGLTRYSTLAETEHAAVAAMIRTFIQGSKYTEGKNELCIAWSDRYYKEIDIATGYTGSSGIWVLIPKHVD